MGRLLWVGPRVEGAGSFIKDGAGGTVESGKPALLGGRELGGDLEGGEIAHSVADFLEAMLQGNDVRGEGVRDHTAHRGQGVAQEDALLARVGDGKSAQEGQGLGGLEGVALDGRQQRLLRAGRQVAQALGERGGDAPCGQLLLAARAQVAADGEATFDPLAALAEPARHCAHALLIVVDQRTDHPRLVERGEGARRGVGRQQQALVLGGARRALDHHGQLRGSVFLVGAQALEAVEHFEGTVRTGHHANGQRGGLTREATARAARSQPRVAGAQLLDGHHAQRPRGDGRGHGRT